MSKEIVTNIGRRLELLNRKIDILRITITESYTLTRDTYTLNLDASDDDIQKEYNTWKEDFIIKYYDPRRKSM